MENLTDLDLFILRSFFVEPDSEEPLLTGDRPPKEIFNEVAEKFGIDWDTFIDVVFKLLKLDLILEGGRLDFYMNRQKLQVMMGEREEVFPHFQEFFVTLNK